MSRNSYFCETLSSCQVMDRYLANVFLTSNRVVFDIVFRLKVLLVVVMS